MERIPDHPVIQSCERTGYPDRSYLAVHRCPICDEEADEVYIDKLNHVVGCPNCVRLDSDY